MKKTTPSRSLTPTKLRAILSATFALILLAGGGLFYLAYNQLSETATETGTMVASARESEDTLQRLQNMKQELESKQDIIQKTELITADSQDYAYQNRIINDLTTYAARAGMEISNISFSSQASDTAATASPPPVEDSAMLEGEAPGASPVGGPDDAVEVAPAASLQKANVNITLNNPVDYKGLLIFLNFIEQNVMKLKVSNISLTKSEDNLVTTDVLNLEVYIR